MLVLLLLSYVLSGAPGVGGKSEFGQLIGGGVFFGWVIALPWSGVLAAQRAGMEAEWFVQWAFSPRTVVSCIIGVVLSFASSFVAFRRHHFPDSGFDT